MSEQPSGQTGPSQPSQPSESSTTPRRVVVRRRRAPRYVPFALSGALLGVLAGLVLAWGRPVAQGYSFSTVVAYFVSTLGLFGTLAALGVAVLLERRAD